MNITTEYLNLKKMDRDTIDSDGDRNRERSSIVQALFQEYKKKKHQILINVETREIDKDGKEVSSEIRDLVDVDKTISNLLRVSLKPVKEEGKKVKLHSYQLFELDPSDFWWKYQGHNRHYLDVEMLASIRFEKEIGDGSFKPMPKKYKPVLFDPTVEKFTAYFTAPIKCEVVLGKSTSLESEFVPLGRKIPFSGTIKLTFEVQPKKYKVYVTLHE